jgi:aminoglycoside 6'-N-acetyltransferase I
MRVRPYQPADRTAWLRMRLSLWPELTESSDPESDGDRWLARPDAAVLVVEHPANADLVGFAEVGERPYADGCDTSPVAYLEGWYVEPAFRGQGLGAALLRAVETWARERGYHELASDALLDNITSQSAHLALGFSEVERAVKYRKPL